jgi:hypothetical protein
MVAARRPERVSDDVSVRWGYVVCLRGGKVLRGGVHCDLAEAEREFKALQV